MKQEMKLADAQHVLAFEYAFESWRQLKEYVASDVAAVETAVLNEDAAALDEALRTDPQWRRRQEKWRGERRERDLLTYVATRGSIRLVDVLLGHGVQSQVDIPSVCSAVRLKSPTTCSKNATSKSTICSNISIN